MTTVLVLATFADAVPSRAALELLTLARRVGDPVVVVLEEVSEAAAAVLAAHGATRVLSVQDPAFDAYLVAPKSEALTQVAATVGPDLVLLTSSVEGKEVAGRLAVRLGASLVTDAVDLDADGTATKSVFAGGWTTRARPPSRASRRGWRCLRAQAGSCARPPGPARARRRRCWPFPARCWRGRPC